MKQKRFKFTKGLFTVKYDTAKELGAASAEIWFFHGELIENPYEPDKLEYDEFNESRTNRLNALNGH